MVFMYRHRCDDTKWQDKSYPVQLGRNALATLVASASGFSVLSVGAGGVSLFSAAAEYSLVVIATI